MSYFRNFDGMCWPAPSEATAILGWRLAWAPDSITKEEKLVLAAFLSAYRELIYLPTMTRNDRVRELRKGPSYAVSDTQPAASTRAGSDNQGEKA